MTDARAVVVDAGARYGVHPSWRGYDAELLYFAVEPDAEEAARLRANAPFEDYVVIEDALDAQDGERDFHLTKHRALSSFLKPDLASECFAMRADQAEIEKTIKVRTRALDSLMREHGAAPDFLKIDTEATEYEVIQGAEQCIAEGVLGIRSSTNFQKCYAEQKIFTHLHDHLLARDFILLNLDYFGYGNPKLGLFRKPDPVSPEDTRYGTLVFSDGVWIRRAAWLEARYGEDPQTRELQTMKLAAFCFLNGGPDVGVDLLVSLAEALGRPLGAGDAGETRLFASARLKAARYLGRWRTIPDSEWAKAQRLFEAIYGEPLGAAHAFYPQVQAYEAALKSS